MEAKLIVVGGKANKAEVQLTLPAVIGRGRDADLTVAHATVSRRHCMLFECDGALVVRDNSSLNGTVIEGERIQEAVLRPGATLTVGPLTFRAEYEHNGEFPSLDEQPALSSGQDTVDPAQPANGAMHKPQPAEAAADSEPALDLADTQVPAGEEAPSFSFLSEASAVSGELGGLGSAPDEPAAETKDSADFGYLGSLGEPEGPGSEGPGEADSQLPEITLHDPEEPEAATEDSGDYALLADSAAPAFDTPVADEPAAGDSREAPDASPEIEEQSPRARQGDSDLPNIKVGSESPKAAAADDDELNGFFNSLGLD